MSVIVKGMKMPTNCASCRMAVYFLDTGRAKCYATLSYIKPERGKRSYDCPLLPLPEKHGRLIDAKALDYAFTDLRFNDDGSLRHWDDRKKWCLHGREVESLIENAETIVEAEGD